MTLRSSTFNILLLNTDSEIQAHYKDLFGEQAVTIGRDGLSLPKDPAKRAYDAVIVESKAQSAADLGKLFGVIDPARTLLVVGSRTVLKRTATSLHAAKAPESDLSLSNGNAPGQSVCLESFLEHKVGDFVKGMRNGSGRNLHPMLIAAVERPLILLTLRETKGNQIQAAELLGLNRNTLRKRFSIWIFRSNAPGRARFVRISARQYLTRGVKSVRPYIHRSPTTNGGKQ